MTNESILGKVIGSKDHTHYYVKVDNRSGNGLSVHPVRGGLGEFVWIGEKEGSKSGIVGIITSSRIFSEEGFNLGFFQDGEVETFAPELSEGTSTILVVAGIGTMSPDGQPLETGIPLHPPAAHDPVFPLDPDDIIKFHSRSHSLNLGYLTHLMVHSNSEERSALVAVLKRLSTLMPERKSVIDLIVHEIEWEARMAH